MTKWGLRYTCLKLHDMMFNGIYNWKIDQCHLQLIYLKAESVRHKFWKIELSEWRVSSHINLAVGISVWVIVPPN